MTRKKSPSITGTAEFDTYTEIGTSGLKQYGGVIDEEWLRLLKGPRAMKKYREMIDNSSVIGAIRFAIKALVRQVEWRVEPADDSDPAIEAASFVEECLDDMAHTLDDFISEILSCLDYGWSFFEIVYKMRRGPGEDPSQRSRYSDGRIGWRKFAIRSQDTLDHWEFDSVDSGLRGMWQSDLYTGMRVLIPIEKAVLFRTEICKNNPEGRSLFRNSVVDYEYLKRISEIEAIGIERDLAGMPVMEVPIEILSLSAGAPEKALRADIEKMLAEIKADERAYAVIPSEISRDGKPTGYKFKLLSSGGGRAFDTSMIKNYYTNSILRSVLAQFLTLGTQGVGSFALASSQTDLFASALGSFLGSLTETFNRYGLSKIMELNSFPVEVWPELVHGDLESPSLAEIGGYVQALALTGNLPVGDDALQRRLLEIGGLPMPVKKTDAAMAPAVPAPAENPKAKPMAKARRRGRVPLRGLSIPAGVKG